MTKKINVEKLFLIAALFPFVSFYPIGTDVQPLAGIFAILVILKYIFNHATIKREFIFLIGISFIMIFYINPFEMDVVDIKWGKSLSLFVGVVTIVAFFYAKKFFTIKIFKYTVYSYFTFSILMLIQPDVFLEIQSHFVRHINSTNIYGARGIATFSTEPGMFAGLLIAFLILNDYFLNFDKQSKKSYILHVLLIVIMLYLTKSGTGYLYFLIYLFIKSWSLKNKKFKYSLYMIGIILIYILYNINISHDVSRGLYVIKELLHNPMEYILRDQSIFTRVIAFTIGIQSILYYPFGVGISDVHMHVWMIIEGSQFLMSFPKFEVGGNTYLVSAFSNLTVRYGLFWWALFYYLFFRISNTSLIARIFAIIFITFSYSAAFPLIWILLYLNNNEKQKDL